MRERLGFELVVVGLVTALAGVAWDLGDMLGHVEDTHQHDMGAVAGHNVVATIVVVLGVVLAVMGSRAILLGRPASREAYALFGASSLMIADGVLHFYAVGDHVHVLLFAAFFVAAGSGELVLGLGLFRARGIVVLLSTLLLVGLIVGFFVTRVVPAPGMTEPEQTEPLGVLSKALEFAALVPLGYLAYRRRAVPQATSGVAT